MPITATAQQPPAVDKPKHKLSELTSYELRATSYELRATSYELRDHRRELESAIAYFDKQDPVPVIRANLQAALDAVIAEQDDRKKLADA